jgi:glucose dehydrogenase
MRTRLQWFALPVVGILLTTWIAVGRQNKKVDDNALKNATKSTEWLTYGMGWSEQRHSTMTQITPANISKLALAWSYEVGPGGGKQEATPLFSNGVMYVITNWSITSAIDARTGKEIWRYDPQADRTMVGTPGKARLCCGVLSPWPCAVRRQGYRSGSRWQTSGTRCLRQVSFCGPVSPFPSPKMASPLRTRSRWPRASQRQSVHRQCRWASTRHSADTSPHLM